MSYTIAKKTLLAIEEGVQKDQGASYRSWLQKVLPHIGDAYRAEEFPFREHLGASLLGKSCGRAIYYGWRWSVIPKFAGRILRLFNRGHLEEGRFIALLLMIGVQVYQQDENGKQFRISHYGGHLGGSGDGILIDVPDLEPGTPCLFEAKTHNDKSFKLLVKSGVKVSKPEHYVQCQTYMRKMGLPVTLYMGVNKNDDDLHAEILYLETEVGDQYIDRVGNIIQSDGPPAKISENPSWFECKWCDFSKICHNGHEPEKNCRTCMYSFPDTTDGKWYCRNPVALEDAAMQGWEDPIELSKMDQYRGCDKWEKIRGF